MKVKVKVIPQQAEVAQGIPDRLRPRIFLTFGTTRVVGRQPYAPAAFTPGEIPGTHFQGLSRPPGHKVPSGEPRKKSPVTPPGIDPGTVRLVAQCLNHYANPGLCTTQNEHLIIGNGRISGLCMASTHLQICVAKCQGYVLRNASLGDFVVVGTCTYANLESITYYTPRLYGIAYCS